VQTTASKVRLDVLKRLNTVQKFNPNHDELGRFSTGVSASSKYVEGFGHIQRSASGEWTDSQGVSLAPRVTMAIRMREQLALRDKAIAEGTAPEPPSPFKVQEVVDRTAKGLRSEIPAPLLKTVLDNMADRTDDPNIANIRLDVPWVKLGRESLGLTRDQAPQVPTNLKEKFLSDMEARGVKIYREELSASPLTPTQTQISGRAAGQIMRRMEAGKDRFADNFDAGAVIVSADNYVIDGHHRWAGQVASEMAGSTSRMRALRIGLNAKELIGVIRAWDVANNVETLAMGEDRGYSPATKMAMLYKAIDMAVFDAKDTVWCA